MNCVYGLIVQNVHVKTVKNVLEENHFLHGYLKIRPDNSKGLQQSIVPSTLKCDAAPNAQAQDTNSILEALGIQSATSGLVEDVVAVEVPDVREPTSTFETGMMLALEAANFQALPCSLAELINILPKSYSVYSPMLLLPFHAFSHPRWQAIVSMLESDVRRKDAFFAALAARMSVTRIAINAIIPASNISSTEAEDVENILRSPTNLQPIYGDFGPKLPAYPEYSPCSTDYAEAFWVSTKQNKIHQCWAPRYTMFSAGNVTEKARLLTLSSVTAAVDLGKSNGTGCAAVDLFAGIGYFAFSYVKAGCAKVLCWDLNPWSIEGLKRGADLNRSVVQVFDFEQDRTTNDTQVQRSDGRLKTAIQDSAVTLIAFRETNQNAMLRIERFRSVLPPIRHVNCGTLPTIGEAWKTAVQALDLQLGGHIHLHETCADKETTQRANHYVELILQYAETLQRGDNVEVQLEHIETVKSIGPRLLHVVFDIRVAFHWT